jgi:tRNA dimethylallyltransferase
MDIGTGKPAPAELKMIPHYGLDCVEPGINYSVHQFILISQEALRAAASADGELWVCGGTGLYIRALVERLALGGAPRPALRLALQTLIDQRGAAEVCALLGLTVLDPHNPVRVIRAAESACLDAALGANIYAACGLDVQADAELDSGSISPGPQLDSDWECGGVAVLDPGKEELLALIQRRVEKMFAQGLVEEVRLLRQLGYGNATVVTGGIGYREAGAVLDGKLDIAAAITATVVRTRQYAKRQRTYFRGMGWRRYRPDELDIWASTLHPVQL